MHYFRAAVGAGLFVAISFASASFANAGLIVGLDFSQNSSLPSAQGMTYFGSQAETTVFSVSNSLLRLNTSQFIPDVTAWYEKPNSYNSGADGEITTRLKVNSAGNFGISFNYYDASYLGYFTILKNGWIVNNGLSGPVFQGSLDTSVFHVYDIKTFAASRTFQFSIDGVVVASGAQSTSYGGPPNFFFGDGTPTGGNVQADISYVRYYNGDLPTAQVPEPSTVFSFGIAGLTWMAYGWRRRRTPLQ